MSSDHMESVNSKSKPIYIAGSHFELSKDTFPFFQSRASENTDKLSYDPYMLMDSPPAKLCVDISFLTLSIA